MAPRRRPEVPVGLGRSQQAKEEEEDQGGRSNQLETSWTSSVDLGCLHQLPLSLALALTSSGSPSYADEQSSGHPGRTKPEERSTVTSGRPVPADAPQPGRARVAVLWVRRERLVWRLRHIRGRSVQISFLTKGRSAPDASFSFDQLSTGL